LIIAAARPAPCSIDGGPWRLPPGCGAGERWEQPIVRQGTKRKLGFIAAGTDVPVPSGPGWDAVVADVADTAIEDMLMNEMRWALGLRCSHCV